MCNFCFPGLRTGVCSGRRAKKPHGHFQECLAPRASRARVDLAAGGGEEEPAAQPRAAHPAPEPRQSLQEADRRDRRDRRPQSHQIPQGPTRARRRLRARRHRRDPAVEAAGLQPLLAVDGEGVFVNASGRSRFEHRSRY